MLTMQELTQHFKPILARTIDTKEPTDNGIKIPYKNIAKVCIEFAPGESYSFFGSAKECALSLWRINLMWQLAKKGVPTHLTARKLELKWMGEKAAFGLFGGAFCDPVLYGTRMREPGVFIKTQKPANFSKTVGPC